MRRVLVFALVAGGAGACATEEERKAAAELARVTGDARQWMTDHGSKLCPLEDAEVWESPFDAAEVRRFSGTKDEYSATIPFWCLGKRDGETARISAVGHFPSGAPGQLDYQAATISQVETVSGLALFLYWLVPMGIALALTLIWHYVPLSSVTDNVFGFGAAVVLWLFSIPGLGVLLIAAGSLVAPIWWTHQLFHAAWAYLLTPLQIVPMFAMLARVHVAMMRGLKG